MNADPDVMPIEDLLQALATGDLDAGDARVARRLAADGALREQWHRMQATIARLGDIGTDHRDAIGDGAPRTAAAPTPIPPVTRRREWPAAIAAAAIAVVIASWAMRDRTGSSPDPSLGGGGGSMSPNGTPWREGEPLRWAAVRGASAYQLE